MVLDNYLIYLADMMIKRSLFILPNFNNLLGFLVR